MSEMSSDIKYIIQMGNRWTGLFLAKNDRTEYSVKKNEKLENSQKSDNFF